ncbi:nucleocapsid protein [Rhinolophus affinis bat coronavirus HKU2-related]|nr:nucleocapsid protein [Rhinolophus affinis bat coronavirus HKU2-related]
MATVNWGDAVEQAESRGRKRIPLSLFAPLRVTDGKNFWNVMPRNGVPTGRGNPDQQIGYWVEQKRWRMQKGQRKDQPSNWHFYYLGTGPHSDVAFRKRTPGVHWVAVDGAKTSPTSLGVRNRNKDPIPPQFAFQLPADLTVVDVSSRNASRSQSRSRPQSQTRSGAQTPGFKQQQQQPIDIVAAVRQALADLGIASTKSRPNSGKATPRQKSRATSPAPMQRPQRKQLEKPEWKRSPNTEEDVHKCFGPRTASRNFGDADLVQHGVEAKHFPTIAELLPTQAAIAFGSEVVTKEVGDAVEITFHYTMKVPKSDKNLPRFLEQVSAYSRPSQVKRSQSQELSAAAPPFMPVPPATPTQHVPSEFAAEEVEMVDEIIN